MAFEDIGFSEGDGDAGDVADFDGVAAFFDDEPLDVGLIFHLKADGLEALRDLGAGLENGLTKIGAGVAGGDATEHGAFGWFLIGNRVAGDAGLLKEESLASGGVAFGSEGDFEDILVLHVGDRLRSWRVDFIETEFGEGKLRGFGDDATWVIELLANLWAKGFGASGADDSEEGGGLFGVFPHGGEFLFGGDFGVGVFAEIIGGDMDEDGGTENAFSEIFVVSESGEDGDLFGLAGVAGELLPDCADDAKVICGREFGEDFGDWFGGAVADARQGA